jgi:hypothetical protein
MSEVEILPEALAVKVQLRMVPINYLDYEQSQSGVLREIRRLNTKLKKTEARINRVEIQAKIKKLRCIDNDLQKAMEL